MLSFLKKNEKCCDANFLVFFVRGMFRRIIMLPIYIKMLQNNSYNSSKQFICKPCDYKCSKKNDMTKHESSQKHKCNIDSNNCNPQFVKNEMKCNLCDKLYKSRVGLWRH